MTSLITTQYTEQNSIHFQHIYASRSTYEKCQATFPSGYRREMKQQKWHSIKRPVIIFNFVGKSILSLFLHIHAFFNKKCTSHCPILMVILDKELITSAVFDKRHIGHTSENRNEHWEQKENCSDWGLTGKWRNIKPNCLYFIITSKSAIDGEETELVEWFFSPCFVLLYFNKLKFEFICL